jgi:hypothetical protein
MATARVIPEQDQQITINAQGDAHPSAVTIANNQHVQFNNNSGATISIYFLETAIHHQRGFTDIINLQNGESYTQAPLVSDIMVNYTILMNGKKSEPFAIEVGTGPLEISVTGIDPTPEMGAMPPNGEVLFQSADGYTHNLSWLNGDPFNPPIDSVTPAGNSGKENGNKGRFRYTVLSEQATAPTTDKDASMLVQPMGGGGTIKVT